MARLEPREPRSTITFDLPRWLIAELDKQAARRLFSRAALLRQLILDDLADQAKDSK